MLLNCCFENVEFVLVAAPLGLPLEPRSKEPQHGDGDNYVSERGHAATLSSLSAPRITILSASSGNGRCNAFASSHGARIQTSRSSSVSRITGMALGWIGSTTAFGLDNGLMGTLLRYPYQVRDEREYFDEIQDVKVTKDSRFR